MLEPKSKTSSLVDKGVELQTRFETEFVLVESFLQCLVDGPEDVIMRNEPSRERRWIFLGLTNVSPPPTFSKSSTTSPCFGTKGDVKDSEKSSLVGIAGAVSGVLTVRAADGGGGEENISSVEASGVELGGVGIMAVSMAGIVSQRSIINKYLFELIRGLILIKQIKEF